MIEKTGNRIANPDSVWNSDGSRKMERDQHGQLQPVAAVIAPGSLHNIREDEFKGTRKEGDRKFGPMFYDEAQKAADAAAAGGGYNNPDGFIAFQPDQKTAVGQIEALGAQMARGDEQAYQRLLQVYEVEMHRPDGKGPRGVVLAALKRTSATPQADAAAGTNDEG